MKNRLLIFLTSILFAFTAVQREENPLKTSGKTGYFRIKMTFNNTVRSAKLYNNATNRNFIGKLPLTLNMRNIYGREMVYRFPDPLPAEEASFRGYKVGEIIYYPPLHSFVIMYKQNGERFSMQSMGYIDGDVGIFENIEQTDIRFELIKD